jgi:CheY-like chemotaxis protein
MHERIAVAPAPAGRRAPVVLVVEDEILVRIDMAMSLSEAGYTVIEAATGDEALSVLEGGHPVDLVFTDVRMPGRLDGIALSEIVRRRYPLVPVIVTSANPDFALEGLDDDVHFIAKPYAVAVVLREIARTLKGVARTDGPDPARAGRPDRPPG